MLVLKKKRKKSTLKWLSVYEFDQDTRTFFAPRNLRYFRDEAFTEIVRISPCGDTYIIEVKVESGKTLWIDEYELRLNFIGHSGPTGKTLIQQRNKKM